MILSSMILLVLSVWRIEAGGRQCDGWWVEGDTKVPLEHFLGMNRSFETFNFTKEGAKKEFSAFASCPVEIMGHSCFYLGMTERANKLMRRRWQLTDTSIANGCLNFDPVIFLHGLRDRTLWLTGDSTMSQLFQAVVCKLLEVTEVPPEDIHFQWLMPKGTQPPPDCPVDEVHCALTPGGQNSVHFAEYNATITIDHPARYGEGMLPRYVKERHMQPNDVYIYNFGLHYGPREESEFIHHLKVFLEDIQLLQNVTLVGPAVANLFTHNLYFLESFPQDFEDASADNGYFNTQASSTMKCARVEDLRVAHNHDFRSRHLEEHLIPHGIPVIRITDGLRSQWDAHMMADSKMYKLGFADCTHYCNPSRTFDFILTQIQNTVNWNSPAKLRR